MNGVCASMGFVPSFSTFCSSWSVTVRPSSVASFSMRLACTYEFQTMSFTWFISSSERLSRPCVILMTCWYSSRRFWNSCTLIFFPSTSPTCCLLSLRSESVERTNSSAMNAKSARPMTETSTVPQLLIFPIAAIVSVLFILFFLFFLACGLMCRRVADSRNQQLAHKVTIKIQDTQILCEK